LFSVVLHIEYESSKFRNTERVLRNAENERLPRGKIHGILRKEQSDPYLKKFHTNLEGTTCC
ncbi:MAG: hypothetical protein ACI4RE_05145, partial [Christensenellales bacterium]